MWLFSPRARCALNSTSALLFLIVLCLLALPQQPAIAHEGAHTYRVVGVEDDDVLNIRAGPSMGHRVVGAIPPGGRGVRVVGHCQGWCPVSYNGASGWVNGYYLAAEPAVAGYVRGYVAEEPVAPRPRKRAQLPAYWRVTGVAEGESLKVHDTPSPSASVVHAFEPQSGCIKLAGSCQKPWCQVKFPGLSGDRVGWVDSKHLVPTDATCSK
jgi:SH3-like domain-containing protein